VLGALVKNRIFGDVDSSLVITFDGNWSDICNSELIKQPAEPSKFSNEPSLYSALVEERATVPYFLDFHEIKLWPKKIT